LKGASVFLYILLLIVTLVGNGMADIFIVKQWLKGSLNVVGFLWFLSVGAGWYQWSQLEFAVDRSQFHFAVVIASALALGWVGLLLTYFAAVRMGEARGRSLTDWVDSVRWGRIGIGLAVLFFVVGGYSLYSLSAHGETEFDLLRSGQLTLLEEHLAANPLLLSQEERKSGETLVQVAFRENYPEAFVQLMALGASPKGLDVAGRSPVSISVENIPMLGALMTAGFRPDLRDEEGILPMQYAVAARSVEAVVLLAAAGATVDARDGASRTPLMTALMNDDFPLAEALIGHGANVNVFDQRGNTPLHEAVLSRNPESIRLLLEHEADPRAFNLMHMTPLHLAARAGQDQLIDVFLELPNMLGLCDAEGRTPLACALEARKYDTAELLIEQGADMNRVGPDGATLLHKAVLDCDYRTARFLVRAGADVNIRNRIGETAHDIMRRKEQEGLLELVAERDAPVGSTNTVEVVDQQILEKE